VQHSSSRQAEANHKRQYLKPTKAYLPQAFPAGRAGPGWSQLFNSPSHMLPSDVAIGPIGDLDVPQSLAILQCDSNVEGWSPAVGSDGKSKRPWLSTRPGARHQTGWIMGREMKLRGTVYDTLYKL
jgi:hypothetical protein